MFGSYDLSSFENFDFLIKNCPKTLDNKDIDFKYTGQNSVNRFCRIEKEVNKNLESFLNNKHNTDYDWTFEYFHSAAPVGIHTDYDKRVYPNPDKNGIKYYEMVAGFIAPIEWTCKQPYTLNFDRLQVEPRKIMWKPDHKSKQPEPNLRYLDTNEVINYRTTGKITNNIEKYVPEDCVMYEQMQDIEIHDVYKWEIGTYMLFDTRRWHSSSWYSSKKKYNDLDLSEYKRSIIGFATQGFRDFDDKN